jgi:chemotaxis protein CheD
MNTTEPSTTVKKIVGVAAMLVSRDPCDTIVTHALGSCLGIAACDPAACVGGLLHVMMPDGRMNPEKAAENPFMFVDTGVPAFFRELYAAGTTKERLVITVAGGANIYQNGNDRFQIGKRNYTMLKKLFWKNGILIHAEDVGGYVARTMYVEVATGRVWLSTGGVEKDL